jgi:uncharacterized protein (TIGR03083 family)
MELCDLYAACRNELLGLAPSLSAEQSNASLAATPPWTVLDGYRHLAGVCADFLDGVMQGAGSPEWTAMQVTSRQSLTLDEVCDEWKARGPMLEEQMADAGPTMGFLAFDVWTHEQDIRAAIGSRGVRNDERVRSLAALAMNMFGGRYEASGAPALMVLLDGEPHLLGALGTNPEVTLGTSAYELLRIIFGRRSADQISRANWTGDFTSVIDALHIFDLPPIDIID